MKCDNPECGREITGGGVSINGKKYHALEDASGNAVEPKDSCWGKSPEANQLGVITRQK